MAREITHDIMGTKNMEHQTIGETRLRLTYGVEAVTQIEVHHSSLRVQNPLDFEEQRVNLELLPEIREETRNRMADHKRRVVTFHGQRVKECAFTKGQLVVKKVRKEERQGKLTPDWEGPYLMREVLRSDAYKLATLHGHEVPRMWNIQSLRAFYV